MMQQSFRKYLYFASFLLLTNTIIAAKIDKAFEALEVYDYFKAKRLFEKCLKKKTVAAPYGLSVMYSRNDNPFHNLDSAYKYICIADTSYIKLTPLARVKLERLKLDSIMVQDQKDNVDELIFIRAKELNSFMVYQIYIDIHTDSDYYGSAIDKRDSIAFSNAKTTNVPSDYMSFMNKYPGSKYYNKAKAKYEERKFSIVKELNKARHYRAFVYENPKSPYLKPAQDSVYAKYTITKTLKAFHNFIEQNPKNPNVGKAWRNIYKLYTSDYSPERILQFKKDYPAYPFKKELMIDARLANKEFLPYKKGNKWGFIDEEGNVMVKARYDFVEPYSEGLALVGLKNKLGFIDKNDRITIPIIYEDGESFKDGLAIVGNDDLFGMIDKTNKQIIHLKYDVIGNFYSGLAVVANEKGYGYVNKKGHEVIPLEYNNASDFERSLAVVWKDGKKGIIDSLGGLVVPIVYNWIELFNNKGLCRALNDSLYGVLSKSGDTIVDFEYNKIGSLDEPLIYVAKNDKYGYLNHEGEFVTKLEYDFIHSTSLWGDNWENGHCKYLRKGKFGMIDSTGLEVFPAIFENIGSYSNKEWIAVKKRGKWGYCDNELQLQIPYSYKFATTFEDSVSITNKDELWGLINIEEDTLLSHNYQSISKIDNVGYQVKKGKLSGLYDNQLKLIVPISFKEIKKYNGRWLQLYSENNLSYFDREKMKTIEVKD